jgi:hypothetical protein
MDVLLDVGLEPDCRVTETFVGEEITECLPESCPVGDGVEGNESRKDSLLLGH